jgi:hypothetical protein
VTELYDSGVKCSKKGEKRFGMKSEVVGRPSVVGDDFVQLTNKFMKDGFTVSELVCYFPQISHTLLFEIIMAGPGCHTSSSQDGL